MYKTGDIVTVDGVKGFLMWRFPDGIWRVQTGYVGSGNYDLWDETSFSKA